ncbi:MAG: hypothetical protein SFV32_12020 [Opitutaceae bacterium]|nr:hypothetical protein [Opitutaceae bacterium]
MRFLSACVFGSLLLRTVSFGQSEVLEEPVPDPVAGISGVIGPEGGKLTTPDGAVEVEWLPSDTRLPSPAKVWSIVAPGGAGFQVAGPPGPAQMTCWPPGSERSPGTTGADPVKSPPSGPSSAAEGGVEILGPDQEWTTTKSTLNPDGSRTILITDERTSLRKKGLVKGSSGPYVLVPEKATVLRKQSVRFQVEDQKKKQKEWKDAVKAASQEDDELAPLAPRKKAAEEEDELAPLAPNKKPAEDEDELAPLAPKKPAAEDEDELAPLAPKKEGGSKPIDDDELAPLAPRKGPADTAPDDELAPLAPTNRSGGGATAPKGK